jgi:ABC-type glycerol-3-phosphate transport system substrate-binding protein
LALTVVLATGGCAPDSAGLPPAASQPTEAGAGDDATPAAAPVTITFGAISIMRPAYEPLIQAFKAEHPGIDVQFVPLDEAYQDGGDYNAQTRQIVSSADTAEAPVSEEQFHLGLLYNLKPLMDADSSFDPADFYPSALNSATASGGAIYQLPQTLELPLLV